jgi:hypothetical protein
MIGENVKTDNYYGIFEEEPKEWILKYVDSKLRETKQEIDTNDRASVRKFIHQFWGDCCIGRNSEMMNHFLTLNK